MEAYCMLLQEGVLSSAKEVCGIRNLGDGRNRKDGEWWNDEAADQGTKQRHATGTCGKGRLDSGKSIRDRV